MSGALFTTKVAAVVVAAGASRRMTAIKQLLTWKNTTLLGHVINQLEEAGAAHIFVVLGAHEKEILKNIDSPGVTIIHNYDWSQGMGTSIAKTITYFKDHQLEFDGLLIASCDQPLIKLTHYKKLINSCINDGRIIVSSYNEGQGIPVVFDKIYFNELSTLKNDVGAKSIVKNHLDRLIQIDAPEAAIDLDTKESYELYYHTNGI
jgi:molybdenum cofactor cytidylyltransferase